MTRHAGALAGLALIALAGCKREDMYTQSRSGTWDRSNLFGNESSMRHPVVGTVARDEPNQPAPQPSVITAAMLARGQQRFDIFCAPCHGRSGDGAGMIVQRGFPKPPSLFAPKLVTAKAQHFFDTITNGHGAMYSYADRVSPADRWAITAYIRALQRGQNVPSAELTAADRDRLEASQPDAGK